MLNADDYTAVLIPTMPYRPLRIAAYVDQAKKRKLFKGEYIYGQTQNHDDLYYYYVEKGQLSCSFTKINGEQAVLFYRNAGNAFSVEYGGIASLGDYKMHYYATTDTVVFGFTEAQLYAICRENPEIFYEFVLNCHMAFGQMGHRISNTAVASAMQRIIGWLIKLCAVREPDDLGVYAIPSNITVQQLADLLSIHVTTCSRLLSQLETDGVLQRNRKEIRVLDLQKLHEYEDAE
ncbi:MAG: Crp/Fnr family transcriptional regulator [Coriobacteriales bacterium]|nr:Crp/Fnr family transcriptional regulator [Coriobacteriales bacterium]